MVAQAGDFASPYFGVQFFLVCFCSGPQNNFACEHVSIILVNIMGYHLLANCWINMISIWTIPIPQAAIAFTTITVVALGDKYSCPLRSYVYHLFLCKKHVGFPLLSLFLLCLVKVFLHFGGAFATAIVCQNMIYCWIFIITPTGMRMHLTPQIAPPFAPITTHRCL